MKERLRALLAGVLGVGLVVACSGVPALADEVEMVEVREPVAKQTERQSEERIDSSDELSSDSSTSDNQLKDEMRPEEVEPTLGPESEPASEFDQDQAAAILPLAASGGRAAMRYAYLSKVQEVLWSSAAWGGSYHSAQYRFADVYGSSTEELLITYKLPQGSGSKLQVYTYSGGQVVMLLDTGYYGALEYCFYKAGNALVLHTGGHGGEGYALHALAPGASQGNLALRGRTSTRYGGSTDGEWNYYVNDKSSTKSAYDSVLARYARGNAVVIDASNGWSLMTEQTPAPDPVTGFLDLRASHWASGVVSRAVEYGLINGYKDGRFGPNDKVTRGQVAVILWNMAGKPTARGAARTFPDVTAGKYYYDAVRWASSVGVVNGYGNGRFGPNDNVTREQLAVMLSNYAQGKGSAAIYRSMRDAGSVSSWARSAVGWCFRNKIISGTKDGRINPRGNATRAEAAKMVVFLHDML